MPPKPLIRLYDAAGIGVIIPYPSGVLYSNQVGGHSCLQPEIEGVYVPLFSEIIDQEKMLTDHFTGPKWMGGCSNRIDTDDAEIIDNILNLNPHTSIIKVDRTRLNDSCEAWVYVEIAAQPEERPVRYGGSEGTGITASGNTISNADYDLNIYSYPIYGFGKCSGILTWSNSD